MRIIIDTDAFCKLAVGRVLADAVELLGAELDECVTLPALPHMLRKRGLRKHYGSEICEKLLPVATSFAPMPPASVQWQERLTGFNGIDAGEAQIFAFAAEHGSLVISGDKRALRGLKEVDAIHEALCGRVVAMEPLLLGLCHKLGVGALCDRVAPVLPFDKTMSICFGGPTPVDGLRSYHASLVKDVAPLVLWEPMIPEDANDS